MFYIITICVIANMSEEENAKREILEAVLYDDEKGYGSKLNTLKCAK